MDSPQRHNPWRRSHGGQQGCLDQKSQRSHDMSSCNGKVRRMKCLFEKIKEKVSCESSDSSSDSESDDKGGECKC